MIPSVSASTPAPIKRSAVALLANDIVDLLRSAGPLTAAEIRCRLGVASRERFDAAVLLIKGDGSVEQISDRHAVRLQIRSGRVS